MRIGLIGYGKMGKEIEIVAREREHDIVWIATKSNWHELSDDKLKEADVIIEFTSPDSVVDNIRRCFHIQRPVVCGTTGWAAKLEEVKQQCINESKTLLTGSNFSTGVHLFFALNRYAARLLNDFPEYQVRISETHHTQKKDAPSGTAIHLANEILPFLHSKSEWQAGDQVKPYQLQISSQRIEHVPGTHLVSYSSAIDNIELQHIAHNRKGFAVGALRAAEWLFGRTGYFTIEDVFRFE